MARGAVGSSAGGAGEAPPVSPERVPGPVDPLGLVGPVDPVAVVAALAGVDGAGLSDRERVALVAALERVKGAAAAAQARVSHALRVSREAVDARDVMRSVGSQVALARRCSPSLGDRFVGLARALVEEMPATHAALAAGVCSERHAVVMAQATAVLGLHDRGEVDRRVGPLLGRLGVKQAERAARRVAAELDAAAVIRRMEDAVRSRRVTVRPAPDGMAYLTVLGPLVEVVGAHAALLSHSRAVVAGQCPDEGPDGRSTGAIAADTALRLLSGRQSGQVQPIEVHLVMTDRALVGAGDPSRSVMEPARVPGHGSVPAPLARARVRDADEGSVWLRRLYATPDGRDLVAMDSRRRTFAGLLRRMLVLRDDVCTTPWCEAPIVHADHAIPARDGGPTDFRCGNGKCARCNGVKEGPGWVTTVAGGRGGERRVGTPGPPPASARELVIRTPLGLTYRSQPPPLLGWGSEDTPRADDGATETQSASEVPPAVVPALRQEPVAAPSTGSPADVCTGIPSWPASRRTRGESRSGRAASWPPRRPRARSALERHLVRMLR